MDNTNQSLKWDNLMRMLCSGMEKVLFWFCYFRLCWTQRITQLSQRKPTLSRPINGRFFSLQWPPASHSPRLWKFDLQFFKIDLTDLHDCPWSMSGCLTSFSFNTTFTNSAVLLHLNWFQLQYYVNGSKVLTSSSKAFVWGLWMTPQP